LFHVLFPLYFILQFNINNFICWVNKFYKNTESEQIYRPPSLKSKTELNNKRTNFINSIKKYANSNSNSNSNSNFNSNANSNYNNQPNNPNNPNDNTLIVDKIELNEPIVIEINHKGSKYVFELNNIDNLELESLRYSNSKSNKKIYEGKIQLSGLVSVSKN
jgi:hypothetical protein